MTSLSAILSALQGIEEKGGEYKATLQAILADKDRASTELETKLNTANETLKTVSKALGCAETEILPSIKLFKAKDTEVETLRQQLASKDGEITTLKSSVGALERKQTLTSFCGIVGADADVLEALLPGDLEVKVEDVKEGDKTTKQGYVVVDGKSVLFADYVAADSKLSKFSPAIFPQTANPPQLPPKLPGGKSEAPKLGVVDSLKAAQKARSEAIRKQYAQ